MADAYQTYDYKAAGFNVSALKINEIRSILGKEGVHMPQGCKKVELIQIFDNWKSVSVHAAKKAAAAAPAPKKTSSAAVVQHVNTPAVTKKTSKSTVAPKPEPVHEEEEEEEDSAHDTVVLMEPTHTPKKVATITGHNVFQAASGSKSTNASGAKSPVTSTKSTAAATAAASASKAAVAAVSSAAKTIATAIASKSPAKIQASQDMLPLGFTPGGTGSASGVSEETHGSPPASPIGAPRKFNFNDEHQTPKQSKKPHKSPKSPKSPIGAAAAIIFGIEDEETVAETLKKTAAVLTKLTIAAAVVGLLGFLGLALYQKNLPYCPTTKSVGTAVQTGSLLDYIPFEYLPPACKPCPEGAECVYGAEPKCTENLFIVNKGLNKCVQSEDIQQAVASFLADHKINYICGSGGNSPGLDEQALFAELKGHPNQDIADKISKAGFASFKQLISNYSLIDVHANGTVEAKNVALPLLCEINLNVKSFVLAHALQIALAFVVVSIPLFFYLRRQSKYAKQHEINTYVDKVKKTLQDKAKKHQITDTVDAFVPIEFLRQNILGGDPTPAIRAKWDAVCAQVERDARIRRGTYYLKGEQYDSFEWFDDTSI